MSVKRVNTTIEPGVIQGDRRTDHRDFFRRSCKGTDDRRLV